VKREKLTLFFFIDALGWEVLRRHEFFLQGLAVDRRPLETILGYSSACDPSIISGLLPSQHLLWNSFYYSPGTCPYRWLRHLRVLPNGLLRRGRVRALLSRWVRRIHGIRGYFQLYAVPFELLPLFDYAEKRRIWEPGGLPRGRTIFDLLQARGIPYYVHDSDLPDDARIARLRDEIAQARIDFAYISTGRLDALMHAEGPASMRVADLLRWYDARIRDLLAVAARHYGEVAWYVFTDHGMHEVRETHDLIADVEGLGLEWNVDYVAFYDATMARVWILREQARGPLLDLLSQHHRGRLVPDEELAHYGVLFSDRLYGDLVFLMNSHVLIVPSFIGVSATRGAHGFDPRDADSYAAVSSNRPLPARLRRIHQIFTLMLDEAGLSPACAGLPPDNGGKPQ